MQRESSPGTSPGGGDSEIASARGLPTYVLSELKQTLEQSPRRFGYPRAGWSGTLLLRHLRERYGIALGAQSCRLLLAKLSTPRNPKNPNHSSLVSQCEPPGKLSTSGQLRLSNARTQRVAMRRLKRLASSGLPLTHLVRTGIDLISDALPTNEAAGVQRRNASNRLVMFRNANVARWGPLLKNLLYDAPLETSGMRPFDASRCPIGSVLRSEQMTTPNFHRLATYNEVMGPLGYHHWLVSIFNDLGDARGLLALPRSRGMRPFDEGDVRFLREATPHLAHGIQIASLMASDQVATCQGSDSIVREPAGVVITSWDGHVLGLDQRARSLFQEVGQVDGLRMNAFAAGHLEESLGYVASIMRRIFREGALEEAPVPATRMFSSAAGIVLKLRAYVVEGDASDQRFVTVLVEEIYPPDLFQQRVRYRFGLAQREAQILTLLRLNRSNSEILGGLGISYGTLKAYLREIARKLEFNGIGPLREFVKGL